MSIFTQFFSGSFWGWNGWAAIATLIAALYTFFTFRLLLSSSRALRTSNRVAEFQIYSKIADALYSDSALPVFESISKGNYIIDEMKKVGVDNLGKEVIVGRQVIRYLLNPIEDLAKFTNDGMLTTETIDTGFGSLILTLGSQKMIIDYINHLRQNVYGSDNVFGGFEDIFKRLYKECSDSEKKKYINHFE